MRTQFTKDELKVFTMNGLNSTLDAIYRNYDKIYDLYHDNEDKTLDVIYIHDMIDALKGIDAVLDVYVRDNYIHPNYACEKLKYSLLILQTVYEYFAKQGKGGL